VIYANWESVALKMMRNMWGQEGAFIFHEPVDPEKLGIEDYFEKIEQPMDFTQIKKKIGAH